MPQVHYRPGFTPRVTHEKQRHETPPARVTSDMQPALAKRTTATPPASSSPLTQTPGAEVALPDLTARAEAAMEKLRQKQDAERKKEIIANPTPSPTPVLTTPHVQ